MQRHFAQIDTLETVSDVLAYARDVFVDLGVTRMSYHVTPLFEQPNSMTTSVYTYGFSEEWLELYEREACRLHDPIPARVLGHGAMLTWQQAMAMGPNTAGNESYFARMREHGLVHGFGVPLFGPRGRDAYASFDFDRPLGEVSNEAIGIVRSLAQAAHQRICKLIQQEGEKPELSEREREVLTWASRGKSMAAIATILDLSPETVKTYLKRVYGKLDVSDRVGASVKAIKLGLISG
ncbi:MAG: LuxR family transcriptional regulator [Erythrobacter sp.]|jgi:DNA-binding CsgD family transcriptional regulator|nr:LuxR family transcriptional regulator [Erythrobacter sp.]